MALSRKRIFYVYVYMDPRTPYLSRPRGFKLDHEPFYIGKGHSRRRYAHLEPGVLSRDTSHKANRIRSIQKSGASPLCRVLKEGLTEAEAFKLERALIQSIGRRSIGTGPLTNYGDGGEGNKNRTVSDSVRSLHSKNMKARLSAMTPAENKAHRDKVSAGIRKFHASAAGAEYRVAMSVKNKRRIASRSEEDRAELAQKLRDANLSENKLSKREVALVKELQEQYSNFDGIITQSLVAQITRLHDKNGFSWALLGRIYGKDASWVYRVYKGEYKPKVMPSGKVLFEHYYKPGCRYIVYADGRIYSPKRGSFIQIHEPRGATGAKYFKMDGKWVVYDKFIKEHTPKSK